MKWFKRREDETYRDFDKRVSGCVQLLVGASLVFATLGLLSLSAPH